MQLEEIIKNTNGMKGFIDEGVKGSVQNAHETTPGLLHIFGGMFLPVGGNRELGEIVSELVVAL